MNSTPIKNQDKSTRRIFFLRAWQSCAALVAAGVAFTGCGKQEKQEKQDSVTAASPTPKDCGDLSHVTEEQIAVREKLGYVNESPLADNQCQNCNLYLPPKEGETCGGCMLFKGPVYAEAYCTYWAPKV